MDDQRRNMYRAQRTFDIVGAISARRDTPARVADEVIGRLRRQLHRGRKTMQHVVQRGRTGDERGACHDEPGRQGQRDAAAPHGVPDSGVQWSELRADLDQGFGKTIRIGLSPSRMTMPRRIDGDHAEAAVKQGRSHRRELRRTSLPSMHKGHHRAVTGAKHGQSTWQTHTPADDLERQLPLARGELARHREDASAQSRRQRRRHPTERAVRSADNADAGRDMRSHGEVWLMCTKGGHLSATAHHDSLPLQRGPAVSQRDSVQLHPAAFFGARQDR